MRHAEEDGSASSALTFGGHEEPRDPVPGPCRRRVRDEGRRLYLTRNALKKLA